MHFNNERCQKSLTDVREHIRPPHYVLYVHDPHLYKLLKKPERNSHHPVTQVRPFLPQINILPNKFLINDFKMITYDRLKVGDS